MSRSVAQLTHRARLGRELEAGGPAAADAARVLAGEVAYDDIAGPAQAILRAAWTERIDAGTGALDLRAEFAAAGHVAGVDAGWPARPAALTGPSRMTAARGGDGRGIVTGHGGERHVAVHDERTL